jgi:uncharacterized protein involved in exopolysaccharide biosynthesis
MADRDIEVGPRATRDDEDATFLDFLLVLAQHKKLLLAIPAVSTVVALVLVLLLPKWYTATAKIMPPQQSQSNAVAILGQLGVLAGGATQALGLKNPSDIYVSMLKSRTVADALIDRFALKTVYDEEFQTEARKYLARNSMLSAARDGVITIEVDDKDPKRAADIANGYIDELRTLTLNLAVSEAGQRRLFFEGQLKRAKNDLTNAEIQLKLFTQDAGIVNPQGQVSLTVAAAASLRAQIAAKEIQLSAVRSYATNANPDVLRINRELVGLRNELAKMEKDTTASVGDVLVPFGKAREVSVEYVRKYRELKYHETLYEVLAKQYEIARIDEAKDATLIQVLDAAMPPEKKSKPYRLLIVLLTLVVASFVAIMVVLVIHSFTFASGAPTAREKLRRLAHFLRPSG